jgi:organic radical activating enzyme
MKKMSKRVNDIFYSLQGEGHNTGRPAAFIRFNGCNLKCPFCDTDFRGFRVMSDEDIIKSISSFPTKFVVLTGGEPTMQVDNEFINKLHEAGYYVAMESNGTLPAPDNIDWLTVSPKQGVTVRRCNELKCLFDESGIVDDCGITADYYYLQPCDVGDKIRNNNITSACVDYILRHPKWRLSIQTHKVLGFK